MRLLKHIIVSFIVFMHLCAHSLAEDRHILFVGNSYTFFNDMPQFLLKMLNSGGEDTYHADLIVRNGGKLADYDREGLVSSALSKRNYNFVVFQENSTTIFYTNERVASEAAFKSLILDARQNGAGVLVVNTWARKAGNPFYAGMYANFMNPHDPRGMTKILYAFTKTITDQNKATLIPVGPYWWLMQQKKPDFDLYHSDGSHPNKLGSYLYAALLFREITGQPPSEPQSELWSLSKDYIDAVNHLLVQ